MGMRVDGVVGLAEKIKKAGLFDNRLGSRDNLRLVGEDAIPEEGGGFETGGFDLFNIRLVICIRQLKADQAGEIFSLRFVGGFSVARVGQDHPPSFQLKTQSSPGLIKMTMELEPSLSGWLPVCLFSTIPFRMVPASWVFQRINDIPVLRLRLEIAHLSDFQHKLHRSPPPIEHPILSMGPAPSVDSSRSLEIPLEFSMISSLDLWRNPRVPSEVRSLTLVLAALPQIEMLRT